MNKYNMKLNEIMHVPYYLFCNITSSNCNKFICNFNKSPLLCKNLKIIPNISFRVCGILAIIGLFMEYQNVLDIKYSIVDIVNAMYNKNYKMNHENIYGSIVIDLLSNELSNERLIEHEVFYDDKTGDEYEEKNEMNFKNIIEYDKFNIVDVIPDSEMKSIIGQVKQIVYSKKYSDNEKTEEVIKILERLKIGIQSFIKLTNNNLKTLLEKVLTILYNEIILKLVKEKKLENSIFIMTSFYNRVIN